MWSLEFAEKISKVGTQPIIGTQINFKIDDTMGLYPLYALNEDGYKRVLIISLSYLQNNQSSDPHLNIQELFKKTEGVALFSGTIHGFFGQLFDKGKFTEIENLYLKFKLNYEIDFILKYKDMEIRMKLLLKNLIYLSHKNRNSNNSYK